MSHPLDEANAKVARARRHLKELEREREALWEANPYRLVYELEHEHPLHNLVVVARRDRPEPIPLKLGMIVGDVVNNLRSALNYLAWQLAGLNGPPSGDVQFPIFFDDPAGRAFKKKPADRFRDAESRYLDGVAGPHRALIERMQPYHGGYWHLLAHVANLNNRDKHQIIPVIHNHIGPNQSPVITNVPPGIEIEIVGERDITLHDDTVVLRFRNWPDPPPPDMKVSYHLTGSISCGPIGDEWLSEFGLRRCARLVELILRTFRGAF